MWTVAFKSEGIAEQHPHSRGEESFIMCREKKGKSPGWHPYACHRQVPFTLLRGRLSHLWRTTSDPTCDMQLSLNHHSSDLLPVEVTSLTSKKALHPPAMHPHCTDRMQLSICMKVMIHRLLGVFVEFIVAELQHWAYLLLLVAWYHVLPLEEALSSTKRQFPRVPVP